MAFNEFIRGMSMSEAFKILFSNWIALSFVVLCLISVVSIVAKQTRKFASHRQELAFNRDLVERGLSVDEIERLVAAKGKELDSDSE